MEISDDGTVRFSNLIEENKAKVTEKLEEKKRGAPAKQRQAAHAFYEALGYEHNARRYSKRLPVSEDYRSPFA